jgi:hypothetical protein
MANRAEVEAARKELRAELAMVERQKQEALILNSNAGIPSVDLEKEAEPPPSMVVEGETEGERSLNAAMQISSQLFAATKSMDQCFKRNARHMDQASAVLTAANKPPKKTR